LLSKPSTVVTLRGIIVKKVGKIALFLLALIVVFVTVAGGIDKSDLLEGSYRAYRAIATPIVTGLIMWPIYRLIWRIGGQR